MPIERINANLAPAIDELANLAHTENILLDTKCEAEYLVEVIFLVVENLLQASEKLWIQLFEVLKNRFYSEQFLVENIWELAIDVHTVQECHAQNNASEIVVKLYVDLL